MSIPHPTDYIVTIREKYARLEKSFRVPSITIGNITKADLKETGTTYTINGKVYIKSDLMFFSCGLINQ